MLDGFEVGHQKEPLSKLVLVGPDFGMKKVLSSIIVKWNISGVIFRDPVTYSQLADIYRSLDVVVSPSRFEVFGMSNLDAMACGRPVVAIYTGGVGTLI